MRSRRQRQKGNFSPYILFLLILSHVNLLALCKLKLNGDLETLKPCFALPKPGSHLTSLPPHLFVLLCLKDRILSIPFSASTIDPKLLTLVLVFSVPERLTRPGRKAVSGRGEAAECQAF